MEDLGIEKDIDGQVSEYERIDKLGLKRIRLIGDFKKDKN